MAKTPTVPDCANCIRKDTCPNAKAGTFCTAFASQTPDRKPAEDPNNRWRAGDDFDY